MCLNVVLSQRVTLSVLYLKTLSLQRKITWLVKLPVESVHSCLSYCIQATQKPTDPLRINETMFEFCTKTCWDIYIWGKKKYYLCLNLYNLNDLHLSNTFGMIWRLWGLTDLFSGDVIAIQAGAVATKVRRHEMRVHPYQRVVTADRGWFSSCASTHYQ